MKKIELGQTITILANVGVISGIVFLAIELRQNNELMEQDSRVSRAASLGSTYALFADNPELAEIVVKSRSGQVLTEIEHMRLSSIWMKVLTDLEAIHAGFRNEDLDPSAANIQYAFNLNPTLGEVWSLRKDSFREEFVEWLDQTISSR